MVKIFISYKYKHHSIVYYNQLGLDRNYKRQSGNPKTICFVYELH